MPAPPLPAPAARLTIPTLYPRAEANIANQPADYIAHQFLPDITQRISEGAKTGALIGESLITAKQRVAEANAKTYAAKLSQYVNQSTQRRIDEIEGATWSTDPDENEAIKWAQIHSLLMQTGIQTQGAETQTDVTKLPQLQYQWFGKEGLTNPPAGMTGSEYRGYVPHARTRTGGTQQVQPPPPQKQPPVQQDDTTLPNAKHVMLNYDNSELGQNQTYLASNQGVGVPYPVFASSPANVNNYPVAYPDFLNQGAVPA